MAAKTISLDTPISDTIIRSLHVGDAVSLNGIIVTGRDAAHKWMHTTFIEQNVEPTCDDLGLYAALKKYLSGRFIYHCGPIVRELADGTSEFVSAGPTTSIREEPYQADILHHFNLKGVIGKGGMGARTLKACQEVPAVYLHAVGGAAALIAQSVEEVLGVYKLDFGIPEAMWIIRVKAFPAVVTMDAHGQSLHENIRNDSQARLEELTR